MVRSHSAVNAASRILRFTPVFCNFKDFHLKKTVLPVQITEGSVLSTCSSSFAAVFLTQNTKQRLMKLTLRQPQVCFMQGLGMRRGRHGVYIALKRTSCLF